MAVINYIKTLFGFNKNFKIQSFTYFIPSPPARSSGYREKQFDKLFYDFINQGFRILHFTTQTSSGEKNSGMWVLIVVQATHSQTQSLNLEDLMSDSLRTQSPTKEKSEEKIDGLYYIDDRVNDNDL
ncbi:MAG: hypothetical protein KBD76_05300 [Bacteriovorax sp.]|nr:hypothetical protein [Bacteriovorax sp.]